MPHAACPIVLHQLCNFMALCALMRPVPPRSAPQSAAATFNEPSTRHRFLSSFSPHFPLFQSASFPRCPALKCFPMHICRIQIGFWETISNTFDKMSLFLCRNRRENVRRKCLTVITQNYSNGCHRQIATICVFSEKCKILNGELKGGKGRRESALQGILRNCRKIESQTLVST